MKNILHVIFLAYSTVIFSQGYKCSYPYLQDGDSLYEIGVRNRNNLLLEKALQVYKNGFSSCCRNDKYDINKEDCENLNQKIIDTQSEISKHIQKSKPNLSGKEPNEPEKLKYNNEIREEPLWIKVRNSDDPAYIESEYLDKCETCKHAKLAKARIDTLNDKIRWRKVKNSKDTAEIISLYLKFCEAPYCNSSCLCLFKRKALDLKNDLTNQIKKDELSWYQIKISNNIDSIQKYINSCSWPCKYREEAASKIREIIKSSKPAMALITGGLFKMGNTFEKKTKQDETSHPAQIKDFYIGIKEISFKEFDAFCTETNYPKPPDNNWGRGDRPAIFISWFDAVRYCNWRSTKDGFNQYYEIDENNTVKISEFANGYRLPTEAEWEYAARDGGKDVKFGNGQNRISPQTINYDVFPQINSRSNKWNTLPTGFLNNKNKLGLYDMSGNVAEWCYDWYSEHYYDNFTENYPAINVTGPEIGDTRVIRGGGYNYREERCTVYCRNFYKPEIQISYIGFRVARNK